MASFTVAVGLGIWIAYNAVEMRTLRAELLGRRELQERLLRPEANSQAPFPHSVREIGFVLNPSLDETSWMTPGNRYAVNSLGLRGPEIPARRPGVKRILLVGDSMFFGWQLPDEHTPGRRIMEHIREKGLGSEVEFITVALPSWNVTSERAFLDHHFDLLDPDYVIWSLLRNDLEDVPGAVPPGTLMAWNSPQRLHQVPFGFQNTLLWDLAMPAIVARWDANLAAIQSFREHYGIPTAILWWTPTPRQRFLQWASQRNEFDLPKIVVPEGFRFDSRWVISNLDPHPTSWATRILAMGIT